MARKVLLTCAVTGGAHTPGMSDAVPVTPAQFAGQGIAAAAAGAVILHLRARRPDDGMPAGGPAVFGQFLAPPATPADARALPDLKSGYRAEF